MWDVSGWDGQGTDGLDVSQQVLRQLKDRRLGLDKNGFSDSRWTDDEDSSHLWLEPISFGVGRRTDTWDSSRIELKPNSFSIGRMTDVWDLSQLGLKSIDSSWMELESINSFGHILCKEVSCLTVLGTRGLTYLHVQFFFKGCEDVTLVVDIYILNHMLFLFRSSWSVRFTLGYYVNNSTKPTLV